MQYNNWAHHQPFAGYQPQEYVPYYNGGDLNGGQPQHVPVQQVHNQVNQLSNRMAGMSVHNSFSQMWNQEAVNLYNEKDIRTKQIVKDREEAAHSPDFRSCKDTMRSTLTKVPESASLLQKSRLPFGILIHPFKEDINIPIIQDSPIVRCKTCRAYINPFVRTFDNRRWQCNVCHRVNEVPDDFVYDYRTRQMAEILSKPELNYASYEYIASVEYMVRPPQPAAYLFVFDCSRHATQLSFIPVLAKAIFECLDEIPGDSRTMIGFIAFDSRLHFFNLGDKQPIHLVLPDIQDVFLPAADNLLVNLKSKRDQIEEFLTEILPNFPLDNPNDTVLDTGSALGPALTAAYKALAPYGGRITLIQATLPNAGNPNDGSVLTNREDPNSRTTSSSNINNLTPLLNPGTDFYKKLALECCEHQIAVDLFDLSQSYSDLATAGSISKYCAGSIHYYGNAQSAGNNNSLLARFEEDIKHYLTRDIGFEAVMRMRCTRGLSIHTFHGNMFVRSTDLLALPNVNPDSGFAMQISIDDDIKDYSEVCFQAAVLYTSSLGERRIRVHTLSLPVVSILSDVVHGADQEAVIGMLSKMAVDRSLKASITEAREALINSVIDMLATYKLISSAQSSGCLLSSQATKLMPLYVLALLKHNAFRVGISTKLDDRVYAMEKLKSLPLSELMIYVYPNLYPLHYDFDHDSEHWPTPLQLTFANIERNGVYLLDTYDKLILYICKSVHPQWLADVFGATQWANIPDDGDGIESNHTNTNTKPPQHHNSYNNSYTNSSSNQKSKEYIVPLYALDNATSKRLHAFINWLISQRPFAPQFHILREDSRLRSTFLQYMYDDRNESAFSYYEFLQHVQQQLKN